MDDAFETNLTAFYRYVDLGLAVHGRFTRVKVLSDAIHGKVYLCRWERDGEEADQMVAIKSMRTDRVRLNEGREANDRAAHQMDPAGTDVPYEEDAMTEIGVYFYLSGLRGVPPNFPVMLACFQAGNFTKLVMEFVDGHDLFSWMESGMHDASEENNSRYFRQILTAVCFLHRHFIGHRDISLENLLICVDGGGPSTGVIKLIDFGGACRTHSESGTPLRYFRRTGKPYYQAPETDVPRPDEEHFPAWPLTEVAFPDGQRGDVVLSRVNGKRPHLCEVKLLEPGQPGQPCQAELWGYEVPHTDVFSCGVVWFILNYGIPPWAAVSLEDNAFKWFERNGIVDLLTRWGKNLLTPEGMELLVAMTQCRPSARPTSERCLAMLPGE